MGLAEPGGSQGKTDSFLMHRASACVSKNSSLFQTETTKPSVRKKPQSAFNTKSMRMIVVTYRDKIA